MVRAAAPNDFDVAKRTAADYLLRALKQSQEDDTFAVRKLVKLAEQELKKATQNPKVTD